MRRAWASIDVLDVETERVLWTISDEMGVTVPSPWWDRRPTFWLGDSGDLVFHLISKGAVVLDTQTGELHPLTNEIRRRERGRLDTACYARDRHDQGTACDARYDGRVIWEGADGWTEYLEIIEVPDGFELHGIVPVPVGRKIAPPPPPARDEMVGPLLLYEVRGEHQYVADGAGGFRSPSTRRGVVYDEGTRRSWSLFNDADEVQLASKGVVILTRSMLAHVHLGGRLDLLDGGWWSFDEFRVSPDGRSLLLHFHGGSGGPERIEVLTLPSGEEVMRLERDAIASLADPDGPWGLSLPHRAGENGWTSDSSAVFVSLLDYSGDGHDTGSPTASLVIGLDGATHVNPCVSERYGYEFACLSPDARSAARGRRAASSDYAPSNWRSFDIIELATDEVIQSVEDVRIGSERGIEWASPVHFAWPTQSNASFFSFEVLRRDGGEPVLDISVLDATTGEIEVMDSGDYFARFYPPSRATTECPAHPAHPCRILLDGKVVGEGRWPRIIGFIELD